MVYHRYLSISSFIFIHLLPSLFISIFISFIFIHLLPSLFISIFIQFLFRPLTFSSEPIHGLTLSLSFVFFLFGNLLIPDYSKVYPQASSTPCKSFSFLHNFFSSLDSRSSKSCLPTSSPQIIIIFFLFFTTRGLALRCVALSEDKH